MTLWHITLSDSHPLNISPYHLLTLILSTSCHQNLRNFNPLTLLHFHPLTMLPSHCKFYFQSYRLANMCKGASKQSAKTDVTNTVIEGNDNSDHSSGLSIFSFHGSETTSIVIITIVVIMALLFLCFIYNRTRALCWLCLHRNLSQKQKSRQWARIFILSTPLTQWIP